MYDSIREKMDAAIRKEVPEGVLFSGGIDSSAILYHAHKYNPNVMAITVGVKGKENPDVEYSKQVAKEMGIENHHIYYIEPEKVKSIVETAVRILGSFNPEWVSSTTTLLLGTMYAKKQKLNSISSGEGADDLLGSFPFFTNWKGDNSSLEKVIKDRLQEIVVMSEIIAKNLKMRYIAPYYDEDLKQELLSIPVEERMKKEGEIKTKYPLRKAYEEILPSICITRPQTMAFTGSGIYDTIKSIGDEIPKEEFQEACHKYFPFRNQFEYALFKMYQKHFPFKQVGEGGCVHCGSAMNGNKINCKTCATLQIDGRELSFDGNDTEDLKVQDVPKPEAQEKEVEGAEGIVIHNGKVVLGMQKPHRWYQLENGEKAAIIKTIGGRIEDEDENNSRNALIREVLEEIKGIERKDIRVSKEPIFTKDAAMGQLNPYESDSDLHMHADFYVLEITKDSKIAPNDLPALVEIPIERFMKIGTSQNHEMRFIKDCVIPREGVELPENYAIMIPREIKEFFRAISVPVR